MKNKKTKRTQGTQSPELHPEWDNAYRTSHLAADYCARIASGKPETIELATQLNREAVRLLYIAQTIKRRLEQNEARRAIAKWVSGADVLSIPQLIERIRQAAEILYSWNDAGNGWEGSVEEQGIIIALEQACEVIKL